MDDAAPESQPRARRSRWEVAEWTAFTVGLATLALYVLPRRGGWEAYVVPRGMAVLLVCMLVLRPWRHCSGWVILAAAGPALGACVVAVAAPYGDGGPISLSRWGLFGVVLLMVGAFARTPLRRQAVVASVLVVALFQYYEAWFAWWGGGESSSRSMVGTLYSANPFGGLMLLFALLAGTVAVLGRGRWRLMGWFIAPLAACGVVFSAARAAIMLLAAGAVVLGVLAFRQAGWWGVARVALLVPLSLAAVSFSTSPVFFENGRASSVAAKSDGGQTLDSTSSVRLDYWRAGWQTFLDEPFVGGGSGSYLPASRRYMAPAAERSPFAHNEPLGALSEGGLALGGPVSAVVAGALLTFTRTLTRALSRRDPAEAAVVAAALAGGALLAHAMVDFALSFPAVLGLLAVLLGVCASPGETRDRRPSPGAVLAVAAVTLCGAYVGVAHDARGVSSVTGVRASGDRLEAVGQQLPFVRDGRVSIAKARALTDLEAPAPGALESALREIGPLVGLDAEVAALRIELLTLQGRTTEALEAARALAVEGTGTSPLLVGPLVVVLTDAGRRDDAVTIATAMVSRRAGESARVDAQLVDVLGELEDGGLVDDLAWTCAVVALQDSGADVENIVTNKPTSAATDGCADWEAVAESRAAILLRGDA